MLGWCHEEIDMVTNQADVDQTRALAIFSQKELTCLWNRMRTARKKAPQEVQTSWSKVEALQARAGKNDAKRNMLFLWLQDPKWSKQTLEEFKASVDTDTRGQREMWVTFGRLEVLCGAAEAKAMVENEELETRDHPTRTNAKLYLWVEEWREKTRRTEHGRSARQLKDVEENEEFDAYKNELMPDMQSLDNRFPVAQPLPLQDAQSSHSQTRTQKKTHKQTETLSQTEKAHSDGEDTVAIAASGGEQPRQYWQGREREEQGDSS